MKMELLQPIPQKYKQLSENTIKNYMPKKLDTLEEMDKFLDTHILQKLKREEVENVNSEEIESVIKNLPTNTNPGPDGFLGEI